MNDGGERRYERKFLIRHVPDALVEHVVRLHPAQFSEIYHQRHVNNCYFDTPGLRYFRDAVEGHSRRMKVRVRWYGDLLGAIRRPVLEIKGKHGLVGFKRQFPLPPLALDRTSTLPSLADWLHGADASEEIAAAVGALGPTLLNRYSRRYFSCAGGPYRITLDTQLEFYSVSPPRLRIPPDASHELPARILEIKYDESAEDGIPHVTNHLPFRLTKSSKYVTGLQQLRHRLR